MAGHNVGAENADPAGTARALAASGADALALLELTAQDRAVYEKGLARAYPYHVVRGTVGLWSTLPLSDTEPIDTRTDYGSLVATRPVEGETSDTRALRTTVSTDDGPLAVYVAHL